MSCYFQILFLLASLMLLSCNNSENKSRLKTTEAPTITNESQPSKNKYSVRLFLIDSLNKELGYGYTILINNTIFIRQICIPSIPGNKGFKNEEGAQKTASLMVYKLEHQMMPPSISKQELDSLGVN